MAPNAGLHQRESLAETQSALAGCNTVTSLQSPAQALPVVVKSFQCPGQLNFLRYVCSVTCNKAFGKKSFVHLHNKYVFVCDEE